jgi:spore maturation protein CgeB
MKIIFSYNKQGYEARCWEAEIRAASNEDATFYPFNHGVHLDPIFYDDSVKLDQLYQARAPRLMQMYAELERLIKELGADVLFVTNCPPYHPDFLRKLALYKVLYSTDDPGATYMRTIPYLHAYEHVMFCAPGYSSDLTLEEKMRYCGMVNADWLPIAVMDFEYEAQQSEDTLFAQPRDIAAIYVGKPWRQKIDMLFKCKQALGKNLRVFGLFELRHNLYVNARYGFPGWVRPVSFKERVKLYQRSKVGLNIHWNQYGFGNQRLFHLPANGVMQICDCRSLVGQVFQDGLEIVAYSTTEELIEKVRYYISHEQEREEIARRAYRRTMKEYLFKILMQRAVKMIRLGMQRIQYAPPSSFTAVEAVSSSRISA